MLEFSALLSALQLCLLSECDVQADSQHSHRLTPFVCLYRSPCCHPAYTAVRKHNPKLRVINFTLFDSILNCLSNPVAIVGMHARNKVFESNLSSSRQPQKLTTRRRDRDLIFVQIPLPHPEICGVGR